MTQPCGLRGECRLEQLDLAAMTVIDGGGGVRRYTPAGTGRWVALNVDRPDTLWHVVQNGYDYYERGRHGGFSRIVYDEIGRHIQTQAARGESTFFGYIGTDLAEIWLPSPGVVPKYQLGYTNGYLTSVTAPGSRVAQIARTGARIDSITDPGMLPVRFGYDGGSPRITSRTDRGGHLTSFSYEPQTQRLAQSRIDPSGLDITNTVVTAEGRGFGSGTTAVASVPVDSAFTLLDGPRSDVTDHTRFWIDPYGAPSRIRDALGNVTLFERTDATYPALITAVVDAHGFRREAVYDARGRLVQQIAVNGRGDNANDTTTYSWHSTCLDEVASVRLPEGELTSNGYETTFCTRTSRTVGSFTTWFEYDAATRLPGRIIENVDTTSFTYDSVGNVRTERTPRGFHTVHFTDAMGRDTTIYTPRDTLNSSASGVLTTGERHHFVYDAMGRITQERTSGVAVGSCSGCASVPAQTREVTREYDLDGRLEAVTPAEVFGEHISGETRAYDAAGRLVARSTQQFEEYLPDPAGNIVRTITGNGDTIRAEYDALNRLSKRIIPAKRFLRVTGCGPHPGGTCPFYSFPLHPNHGDTLVLYVDTLTFVYDSTGSIRRAWNRDARVSRTYFRNGLLRTDTLRLRRYGLHGGDISVDSAYDPHVYALSYAYDRNGGRILLQHPAVLPIGGSTGTTSYRYNRQHGQLDTIIAPLNNRFSIQFDAQLRPYVLRFPGAGTEIITYTRDGQVATRVQTTNTLGTFRSDNYRYDARGKLVSVNSPSGPGYHVRNWYSGLGHLVASDYDDVNSAGLSYLEEWTVDEIGSMRRSRREDPNEPNLLPRVYSYMDQQLVAIGRDMTGITPTVGMISDSLYNHYDGAGSVIVSGLWRTRFSATGTWDFYENMAAQSYYDAAGQLRVHQRYTGQDVNIGNRADGVYEEYRYDALGRRVLLRTRRPSSLCNHSQCHSAIERFVWDGAQLLHELRAPGADGNDLEATTGALPYYGRVTNTHGLALDRPLGVIRQASGSGDVLVVPHMDWRGLFDRGTTSTGAAFTADIRWPGDHRRTYHEQKLEAESAPAPAWYGSLIMDQKDGSGLVYRRNRYYDPLSGRFTQEDPIGIAGGLNLYGFAQGDPVSYTDPFGLCEPFCTALDVAFIAADIRDIRKRGWSWGGGVALGIDVAAAFVPFVPSGAGIIQRGARAAADIGRIEGKLGRQLSHLDRRHLSVAAAELRGVSTGWDHVTEVREAMSGVRTTINRLKGILGNPNLDPAARSHAEQLLGRASKALDEAEEVFRRHQR